MEPLAGDWKVAMTVYIAMGSPKQPVTSTDLVAHREWIAGGRFLRDVTQGPSAARHTGAWERWATAIWTAGMSG